MDSDNSFNSVLEIATANTRRAKEEIPKPTGMKGPTTRAKKKPVPNFKKDDVYWKKRKSNTINSKKSRDRKALVDKKKAEYIDKLEVENSILVLQINFLKEEISNYKEVFFKYKYKYK